MGLEPMTIRSKTNQSKGILKLALITYIKFIRKLQQKPVIGKNDGQIARDKKAAKLSIKLKGT